VELNHLELQFLLLNGFRLAIPVEELEAYGTMLVEFYAREVVAHNNRWLRLELSHSPCQIPNQTPCICGPTTSAGIRGSAKRPRRLRLPFPL
jgi:hypothetical protein